MESIYLLLANVVLVVHGLVVAFNVGVLPFVWAGRCWNWPLVRNLYFRLCHLLLLGFVTVEAALGLVCPLTTLENALRVRSGAPLLYSGGFVSHWLHRVIFWDVSHVSLALLYGLFFALVLLTFFLVRPGPLPAREPAVEPLVLADRR